MTSKHFNESSDQDLETLVTLGVEIALNGKYKEISLTVQSLGGSVIALDQFVLQVKASPSGAWETLISDWSAVVADLLVWKTGTLNLLAHGSKDSARVKIGPVHAIRFQSAQVGVTAEAVTVTVDGYVAG